MAGWLARSVGPAALLVAALGMARAGREVAREARGLQAIRHDVEEDMEPSTSILAPSEWRRFWKGRPAHAPPAVAAAPPPESGRSRRARPDGGVEAMIRESASELTRRAATAGMDVAPYLPDEDQMRAAAACSGPEDPRCRPILDRLGEGWSALDGPP